MRRFKIYAAFFVAVLCVTLIGGRVFATSAYDDVYHTTDSVIVSNPSSSLCTNIDVTGNWADYITDENKWQNPSDASNPNSGMSQARTSFLAALDDDDYGTWSVSQVTGNGTSMARIVWSAYSGTYLQWQTYGLILKLYVSYVDIYCEDQAGDGISTLKPVALFPTLNQSGRGIAEPAEGVSHVDNLFIHSNNSSFSANYPSGYAGESLALSGAASDPDGDGLTMAQEMAQGTLFNKADTDGDGINDLKESIFFGDYNDVFCDNSSPAQCAEPDPLKPDIFVEVDWMDDGTTEYKPTSTQLELVEDMFAAKGINIHFDTGQYGGGEELSTYTEYLKRTVTSGQVDYWDYVNGGDGITASFASDRHSIWRYMIYGDTYAESGSTTGWAEVMGDNLFIAGSLLQNDRAVAGTIAHEIGHTLCLSDMHVYEEQPFECLYSDIDNDNTNQDYKSVMNYRYQITATGDNVGVVYSDGSHGTQDHDDWTAVVKGMGGFSGTLTALGATIAAKPISPDGRVIIEDTPHEITNIKTKAEDMDSRGQDVTTYAQGNTSNTKGRETVQPKDSKGTKKVAPSNPWSYNRITSIVSGAGVLFLVGASVAMWHRNRQ
jgi:hypothetical protein